MTQVRKFRESWPSSMSLVEVSWVDSHTTESWRSPGGWDEALRQSLECRSAGYLYRKSRNHVVVMQSISSTGHLADAMTIPRSAVRAITVLRKKDK